MRETNLSEQGITSFLLEKQTCYSFFSVRLYLAHQVVSLDKELYSTLSVFTQVYKRVLRHTAGRGGGGVAIL